LLLQVKQTQPNINTANYCEFQLYQKRVSLFLRISNLKFNILLVVSQEECQNYPHVLTIPTGTDTIFSPRNNTQVPVNQTILVCGSNAFDPLCQYRDVSGENANFISLTWTVNKTHRYIYTSPVSITCILVF